jgi:uncharacterized protein (DUF362 family)
MGSPVSLVKVNGQPQGLKGSILEALNLIDFKFDAMVKSVVIKPNLCYYWGPSTGYTTDPQIVAAIIDLVREAYGEQVDIKVAEADASAMRTKYAFPALGYSKLAANKKVGLLNLSEDELVETPLLVNGQALSFKVPQSLLKADLFINVPKLKVMRATKITCAMKNLFGCIGLPRKVKYHSHLEEAIVGMNKILRPHLTIVDGIVALGAHPVRLDLIMASKDPFSADWIASEIMGYKPSKVKFLKLAIQEKIGDPKGITNRGENLTQFQKVFPRPNLSSSKHWWKIQFLMMKAYQKLSGDIIPPALEE